MWIYILTIRKRPADKQDHLSMKATCSYIQITSFHLDHCLSHHVSASFGHPNPKIWLLRAPKSFGEEFQKCQFQAYNWVLSPQYQCLVSVYCGLPWRRGPQNFTIDNVLLNFFDTIGFFHSISVFGIASSTGTYPYRCFTAKIKYCIWLCYPREIKIIIILHFSCAYLPWWG